jgi:hypothetical protein
MHESEVSQVNLGWSRLGEKAQKRGWLGGDKDMLHASAAVQTGVSLIAEIISLSACLIGWEGEEQGLARGDRNSTNQQNIPTLWDGGGGCSSGISIPHHELFPS